MGLDNGDIRMGDDDQMTQIACAFDGRWSCALE